MNITPNFHLSELTASEYATRHGIDNTPDAEVLENLSILALGLERVRSVVGQPIIITSGYRSQKVNAGVGGSKTSDHVKGLAADIKTLHMAPSVLAAIIVDCAHEIGFKQCILEFSQWVHVSFPDIDEDAKLEVLTARRVDGKTVYTRGLA
jgi:zinc D-Ala-D-Ala carboxypeptidase